MKQCVRKWVIVRKHQVKRVALLAVTVVFCVYAQAQTADGNAGIDQATNMVKSYFTSGVPT